MLLIKSKDTSFQILLPQEIVKAVDLSSCEEICFFGIKKDSASFSCFEKSILFCIDGQCIIRFYNLHSDMSLKVHCILESSDINNIPIKIKNSNHFKNFLHENFKNTDLPK